MPPSTRGILRLALCGGAVVMGAMAIFLPHLTGSEDMLLSYVLIGAAFLELALAFVLPKLLGLAPAPMSYALYRDRMDVNLGAKLYATVPYAAVERLEEMDMPSARDRDGGFGGLRLYLRENIRGLERLPYYDRGGAVLHLRGLKLENHDFARLKELVEKRSSS